jgi:hypothetical protein
MHAPHHTRPRMKRPLTVLRASVSDSFRCQVFLRRTDIARRVGVADSFIARSKSLPQPPHPGPLPRGGEGGNYRLDEDLVHGSGRDGFCIQRV